jgi:putative FmdB family regulatory protein
MPIYAYKCESCGHRQDVLQKMSDPLLTQCPACGAQTYVKQLTAAGFQLKGSGWYVTDFRSGNNPPPPVVGGAVADAPGSADKAGEKSSDKPADKSSTTDGAAKTATAAPAPAASADKPAAKPADKSS